MNRRSLPPGALGRRLAATPTVSIAVASSDARARLEAALARLVPLAERFGAEIVVCRPCPVEEYRELEAAWPGVLFMPANPAWSAGQLRSAALSAAEGDVVAILGDDMDVDAAWLERLAAGEAGYGTPPGSAVDWRAYFADRGFLPRPPAA